MHLFSAQHNQDYAARCIEATAPRVKESGFLAPPWPHVGDINGTARGTGARFNAGKPPFELIPLRMLADAMSEDSVEQIALGWLGFFQEAPDDRNLVECLDTLGFAGWVECAQVFGYGAQKYKAHNWMRGMPWSVPLGCAVRHLMAMHEGEVADPESGLPHRGHVFCNVVMLRHFLRTYTEGNDLPPLELWKPARPGLCVPPRDLAAFQPQQVQA